MKEKELEIVWHPFGSHAFGESYDRDMVCLCNNDREVGILCQEISIDDRVIIYGESAGGEVYLPGKGGKYSGEVRETRQSNIIRAAVKLTSQLTSVKYKEEKILEKEIFTLLETGINILVNGKADESVDEDIVLRKGLFKILQFISLSRNGIVPEAFYKSGLCRLNNLPLDFFNSRELMKKSRKEIIKKASLLCGRPITVNINSEFKIHYCDDESEHREDDPPVPYGDDEVFDTLSKMIAENVDDFWGWLNPIGLNKNISIRYDDPNKIQVILFGETVWGT